MVRVMKWIAVLFCWVVAGTARAVSLTEFAEVTRGHYQVFSQSGPALAEQVNGFMNEMLKWYSRYFANWQFKDGARVVVFESREDFREYSRAAVGITHGNLAGYCHWKTDEAGNQFYELVAFEHAGLWGVLAHEGFHQFIGYELGPAIPMWLNEGLAQYFENSTVWNGRLVPGGLDATKLAAAQALVRAKRMPAVETLLTLDRKEFYATPEVNYPAAWALVQYLMTRDSASFSASSFRRYLQELKWNREAAATFRHRFGADRATWERDFHESILRWQAPEK
jgi:hypothetical protein